MDISELAKGITKSKIRVMYDLACQRSDTLNFTLGEPDFTTPRSIIDEAYKYLCLGYTKYTANPGIMPLREAIAEKYSPSLKREINPETDVMITAGATEALLVAMQTIMNPGDEILICDPCFASYMNQVRICGCKPRFIPTREENGFVPDCDELEALITDKCKMLLINSPCNPTGAVIGADTLNRIAEIAIKYDLVVISDEVYKDIWYLDDKHVSIASIPGMSERTIVVDAFSKSYAMPGWRLGYAIGPEWIISQMPKTHDATVVCVNAPFQYAGVYALKHCNDDVQEMLEKFKRRRELVFNGLNSIDGLSAFKPKGAFYEFFNIKKLGMSSEDFAFKLLEETGVVLVPGSGFGACGEGYMRMTFASNEETLQKGIDRIASFVKTVK